MATVSMEESSGMAIKKTAGPVMGGEAENNNSGGDKTDERAPLWPVTLATPPHGDIFSPAKPWGDKDSLHGMGKFLPLQIFMRNFFPAVLNCLISPWTLLFICSRNVSLHRTSKGFRAWENSIAF